MNHFLHTVLTAGTLLLLTACGSSTSDTTATNTTASTALPANVQSAIDAPTSALSQELTNTLAFMGNEERLAYDVYNRLYQEWGTSQFINIASNSEYQHITAVQQLIQKYKLNDNVNFTNVDLPSLGYMNTPIESMQPGVYDIAHIQKLYDDLVAQGMASEIDALKVGCIVEVVDVNDLNRDIAIAQSENAADIVAVFDFLRSGSYSHYWSFDAGLKSKGVADGCCSLGETYCHPEYPQNNNATDANAGGNGRR